MTSIADIPAEVFSLIFHKAYVAPEELISEREHLTSLWNPLPDLTTPVREESGILSTYPFNIMGVCQRWQSIFWGMRTPDHYWTRLVFDVSIAETKELLDAFVRSKGQNMIDVIVYSSSTALYRGEEASDLKAIEKNRVGKILRLLDLHLKRCKSVIFDLSFASSLPSVTPFLPGYKRNLSILRLSALIDDKAPQIVEANATMNVEDNFPGFSLSHFDRISLPALEFMDFFNHRLENSSLDSFQENDNISACISNFSFKNDAAEEAYSLNQFLFALHRIFHKTWRLTLHNLSLSSPLSETDTPRAKEYQIITQRLTLRDVSEGFITQFFDLVEVSAMRTDIIHCTIPALHQTIDGPLHLDSIPSNCAINVGSDPTGDQSMQNILAAWQGMFLEVKSCHSFNDELLSQLSSPLAGTTPKYAPELFILRIRDCSNFSPSAMRNFLQSRRDMKTPLKRLSVKGNCPQLTAEDREWFLEQKTLGTDVDWTVDA